MQLTNNYKLKKPNGTDVVNIDDFNSNADIIDNELKAHDTQLSDMVYQTAGGTATAITLTMQTLVNGYFKTFIASANNSGAATTINGKKLYKPGTTTAPNLIAGKAYTVWYNQAGDCFFIKASAEGDADVSNVLATKKFSNDSDTGLVGTMPNNGAVNQLLDINSSYTIPKGYHDGTGKVTQNIATKVAATIIPGTTDQVISANQYLLGAQTVKGDASLVPANIVSGKSVFGVVGTSILAPKFTSQKPGWYYNAAPIPINVFWHSAVYYNGKAYIIAGYTSSGTYNTTLYIYDVATNTWSTGASLPVQTYEMACAVYNGKIYCFGGNYAQSYSYVYDIASNTWTALSPYTAKTQGAGACAYNGKIYVFGGISGSTVTNACFAYDIASNTWTIITSLNRASYRLNCVLYGTKIYVAGAHQSNGFIQIYDISSNTFSDSVTSSVYARNGMGVVIYGTDIYCLGGMVNSVTNSNNSEVYSIINNSWTTSYLPWTRSTFGCFIENNYIHAVGGAINGTYPPNNHDVYVII